MEFRFVAPELRKLDEIAGEVLLCGLFSDERPAHGLFELIDWRLSGQLSRLMARGFLQGTLGEVFMTPLRPQLAFDKAIVFGLGPRSSMDDGVFQQTIDRMLLVMRDLSTRSAVVELPGRRLSTISVECAVDVLLDRVDPTAEHDVWTLVETLEDQKRMQTRLTEQRRRVRR